MQEQQIFLSLFSSMKALCFSP